MSKPLLHLIKTDYDCPTHCTTFSETEYLDGLHNSLADYGDLGIYAPQDIFDSNNIESLLPLQTALQSYHQGSLFPCLELRREYFDATPQDCFRVHLTPGFSFDAYGSFSTVDLSNMLHLQQEELNSPHIRTQIGKDHLDLLFDFISNDNWFDSLLKELETEFDIRRYEIKRAPSVKKW